nr:immunoglobulin heavy chain junction region [Macaca mulatta]
CTRAPIEAANRFDVW